MNRWLALIPLAVLAALAALFIGWSLKRDPAFKPDALVGQTIPETVLPLRARMAWIGQNPHIFAGSLAANVTLGRSGIDDDTIARALAALRLDHVARARGSAPIGEGGAGLSGGEALRLALARIA